MDIKRYEVSSRAKRLKAYLIDDTIVSLFLIIIFYNQFADIFINYQATGDIVPLVTFLEQNSLVFILLRVLYQTFFVWQYGATAGKMLVKSKIIYLETSLKPTFMVALVRAVFRIVSDTIFYIGYIVAFFNPLNQTLHDKIAKTVVIDV